LAAADQYAKDTVSNPVRPAPGTTWFSTGELKYELA
jgi:hypothetical protein